MVITYTENYKWILVFEDQPGPWPIFYSSQTKEDVFLQGKNKERWRLVDDSTFTSRL
ncbi:hypothetical protein Hanom_Chr13g01205501 [Helianthus anomalus]